MWSDLILASSGSFFSDTQTPVGGHTAAVHQHINQPFPNVKIMYGSRCFSMQRLHQNDETKPKIWRAGWRKLKEAALQRRAKCYTPLSWRRGERAGGVLGHLGAVREDKVPVTSACSRLHILDPAGAAAGLCPTKASVTHGGLWQAARCLCLCVQLGVKVFSDTLHQSLSLWSVHGVVVLLLLSSEWSRWRQDQWLVGLKFSSQASVKFLVLFTSVL